MLGQNQIQDSQSLGTWSDSGTGSTQAIISRQNAWTSVGAFRTGRNYLGGIDEHVIFLTGTFIPVTDTGTSTFQHFFIPTRIEIHTEIEPRELAVSVSEQIAFLKSSLGLRITEIAEIIGVERPTVYGWIEEKFLPQGRNRTRLSRLVDFAERWRSLCVRPLGNLARDNKIDGKTLLELFKSDRLSEKKILRAIEALSQESQATRGEKKRRISVADALRRHGISVEENAESDSEINVLSGKRFESDYHGGKA